MNTETKKILFIEKGKKVHKDENLDYSKVVYKNNRTPVIIIDNDLQPNGEIYGEYQIRPYNFLKGQSHPFKKGKKISTSKRAKEEDIIRRFKEVHKGENLDYSEVKYVNMHTKVKIISHDLRPDGTEYGEFWQEPVVHLKGCTHPDIGKLKSAQANKYDTNIFIEKAKTVHQDSPYTYEKVNYVNSRTKVEIICHRKTIKGVEHGPFWTSPDLFLQGKGCPKCGNHLSIGEDEIYEHIVSQLGKDKVIRNDKTILDGKEIDIFVPEKKIGFEFDGIRWHSELFKPDHRYQVKKKKLAFEKGISLIPIFEDEFVQKKNIVLDKIDSLLNICKPKYKAYGRKIDVKEITKTQAQEFLDKFHIQGFASATIYLGGFFNGNLIAVMSFIKEKDSFWNLNRYCTDFSYSCPGVAGKMFSSFIKKYQPKEVKSFLDYRWCKNRMENLYTKLGFVEKEILAPDYRYTNGHAQRLHKFGFRKNKLSKKYGLPLSMTETEMTKKLGWTRIWDCGLIKYVWTP